MDESILNELLGNRIELRHKVSDEFVSSVLLRIDTGVPCFGIDPKLFNMVFCSSINKHTCVTTLSSHPETCYLIFDEHHFELLSAMTLLFYMYGQTELPRQTHAHFMNAVLKTPKKRLSRTIAILLSEKSLLMSNCTQALHYLSLLQKIAITPADYQGVGGGLEHGWFSYDYHNLNIARSFNMNFYVYHELAHIKAKIDPKAFSAYSTIVTDTIKTNPSSEFEKDSVSIEELACDVYALDLLFDYVVKTGGQYYVEYMVDSYVISITNLIIMDSISGHNHFEKKYENSWHRISIALAALSSYKGTVQGIAGFEDAIRAHIDHCHKAHENYRAELSNAMCIIQRLWGSIPERYPLFSKEWKKEKDAVLNTLSGLK